MKENDTWELKNQKSDRSRTYLLAFLCFYVGICAISCQSTRRSPPGRSPYDGCGERVNRKCWLTRTSYYTRSRSDSKHPNFERAGLCSVRILRPPEPQRETPDLFETAGRKSHGEFGRFFFCSCSVTARKKTISVSTYFFLPSSSSTGTGRPPPVVFVPFVLRFQFRLDSDPIQE